jgi:hypothetical protein
VTAAAATLDSEFTNNITVNIAVGYGDFPGGGGLPSQNVSEGNIDFNGSDGTGILVSYAGYRSLLGSHITTAAQQTAFNNLPNVADLPGHSGNYIIGSGQAKAFGLIAPNAGGLDGAIGMGTNFTGSVLFNGALHELTHAMGRIAGTALDLFRFNENRSGSHVFGQAIPSTPAYFSIDGGATDLADFGIHSDPGDWLNSGVQGNNDPFDEIVGLGGLSPVDITEMDVLGFAQASATNTTSIVFSSPMLEYTGYGQAPTGGGWVSQDATPRELADVNGDHKQDIVAFGSAGTYVSLSTGSGFSSAILAIADFGQDQGWASQDATPRLTGDVSGDGSADIVGFAPDGVYVSLSNGNGTFAAPVKELSSFGSSGSAGGWTSQNLYPRELGDLTGNGRDDIVSFGSDGVYVSLATGNGTFTAPVKVMSAFGSSQSAGGWTSQDLYPRLLADVTGNGRDDIVAFGAAGVYVALSNGDGTFGAPFLALSGFGQAQQGGGWVSNENPRELADVNGDGHADIVGFGSQGVYYARGQANGTFGPITSATDTFGFDPSAGGWTNQALYPRLVGDVTGSGKADIVGFGANGLFLSTPS